MCIFRMIAESIESEIGSREVQLLETCQIERICITVIKIGIHLSIVSESR